MKERKERAACSKRRFSNKTLLDDHTRILLDRYYARSGSSTEVRRNDEEAEFNDGERLT